MTTKNINDFLRGWIIGNFENSLVQTSEFEIGIKRYLKGDKEPAYYYKESMQHIIVIEGVIKFNDVVYKKDDIVEIVQWETVTFECLEDCTAVVIKSPHIKGDKYYV